MRRKAVGVVEWFTKAQRQQIVINKEYTASLGAEEAEKVVKEAEAAV